MAITAPPSPGTTPGSAPVTEKPDPAAAARKGGDTDRPGFDLGGARDTEGTQGAEVSPPGSGTMPGGSPDPAPAGTQAAQKAGATGMTDGTGRSPGGTAGGSKPGEATQATAGAVRPPQSTGADQTFEQGNPDDAV